MTSKDLSKGLIRSVFILLGVTILLWFLFTIRLLIAHILIALIISVIAHPLIHFLKRRFKFKKTPAALTCIILFVSIIYGLVNIFIPLISNQTENISHLDINMIKENLNILYNEVEIFLKQYGLKIPDNLVENSLSIINSGISKSFNSIMGGIGSFGIGLFNVTFISFFFMKDKKLFEYILITPFASKNQKGIRDSLKKIKNLLSRYFIGLCIQISILIIIYSTILSILDVRYAFIIGFLCALFNLIPFIGPLIGCILISFFTMTNFLGEDFESVILPKTIYIFIGFAIGQVIDNLISQPLIFSKSVKSHPLEIFLIIIIGGLTCGILGMILAVPFYTSLKVIGKEFLSENKIVKGLTKNI